MDNARIEDKIDKAFDKLASIDATLAAQHVSLKEHMRRTELLEADVAPIKKHVARIDGVLKFLGAMSVLVGFLATLLHMFSLIGKP